MKKTSTFYKHYIKGKKKTLQKEDLFILLKYFYITDYQLTEENLFLKDLFSKILNSEINIPIFLLLTLKILPLYTSKKGDVKNVTEDFRSIYLFLKEFIKEDKILGDLPVLDRFEKKLRTDTYCYCNRLYIIYVTNVTLYTYQCFKNPDDLYVLNESIKNDSVTFDIGDSYWVEPEMLSAPAVFWKFVKADTEGYFLYRYSINTEKRQIYYIRYDTSFINNERLQLVMSIDHPEGILNIIENYRVFKNNSELFACEVDDMDFPCEITLQSLLNYNNPDLRLKKLIRLKTEEKIKQLSECFENEKYQIINRFPNTEYFFYLSPPAITEEYIYFKKETENDEKRYYQVPKKNE